MANRGESCWWDTRGFNLLISCFSNPISKLSKPTQTLISFTTLAIQIKMKLIEFTVLLSAALAEMQNLMQNPKLQLLEYVRPSVTTNPGQLQMVIFRKWGFYFHCVPIKHQFLLPTLKTQKRSIDAPQERRPGAAPQPHSRRSHWSGPPSALSPSHHTLQSSPQGRPSRPENTCETHSKGTKLKHKQTNPIKSEIRSKLLLQASNLAKNGATQAPL